MLVLKRRIGEAVQIGLGPRRLLVSLEAIDRRRQLATLRLVAGDDELLLGVQLGRRAQVASGQAVAIGIHITRLEGSYAYLGIDAPREVVIFRAEAARPGQAA